ncbi:MAG: peptidyl-prolyl cis-trans isomerase [Syntrophorhabdaceae bacterium]|nr:peptidyl-prolyl cis-trans isomerase [Syntrophorhabdaceae bacterium]
MKNAVICLCLALLLFACSKKEDGKVLVTINNDKITMTEFNKELDKIPMNMKMMVASESGKKTYLDRLIIKKLLLSEAAKSNIEKDKEFENRLAEIKEQLIIESLLKKKLTSGANISDEDLQKYYEANKEKFRKDREINTRHILLKSEEEAKQVRDKLQAGEDFSDLAKKYSIDPNAKVTGGEVGFHPKGTLLPEYEAAAFKLAKVGQTSGIVKTQFGYHIIRLEGIKPPQYVPFAEVKDFIKQQLIQEKQKDVLDKYIEELKKSAKITINEELLKDQTPAATPQPESKDAKPEAKDIKPEAKDSPAGAKADTTPPKKGTVPQSK